MERKNTIADYERDRRMEKLAASLVAGLLLALLLGGAAVLFGIYWEIALR
ncbi:hypothetical protein M0R72_13800 [Candidatus Pacearchaeota archaeon]|jgi:hypothetical protein|nr:hypothetical protein [Candidatus Pacearchaeota archaeon]